MPDAKTPQGSVSVQPEELVRLPQDPDPLRTAGRIVRVSIPARAAFDIGAFQQVVVNLAEALGCGKCFSGANCYFELANRWVVNEQLQVQPGF